MKYLVSVCWLALLLLSVPSHAQYQRNKAVPVEKVVFGKIESIRHITEQEIVKDKGNGWHQFGGALIGGAIGNQFGDGSGQVAATILGSIIGANMVKSRHNTSRIEYHHLIEMMVLTEDKERLMVIQDLDNKMLFKQHDAVRLVYLKGGTVRVDKSY